MARLWSQRNKRIELLNMIEPKKPTVRHLQDAQLEVLSARSLRQERISWSATSRPLGRKGLVAGIGSTYVKTFCHIGDGSNICNRIGSDRKHEEMMAPVVGPGSVLRCFAPSPRRRQKPVNNVLLRRKLFCQVWHWSS